MKDDLNEIFKDVFSLDHIPGDFKKNENVIWDSLKHLTLIVEIESRFNLIFSPEEIAKVDSYLAALNLVNEKRDNVKK